MAARRGMPSAGENGVASWWRLTHTCFVAPRSLLKIIIKKKRQAGKEAGASVQGEGWKIIRRMEMVMVENGFLSLFTPGLTGPWW